MSVVDDLQYGKGGRRCGIESVPPWPADLESPLPSTQDESSRSLRRWFTYGRYRDSDMRLCRFLPCGMCNRCRGQELI